jgi:alpha-L-fucosidase
MKTLRFKSVLLSAALLFHIASPAAETKTATTPAPYPDRLQWWTDARFGMFIHWGPISLKGTEIGWSRGAQVAAADYDKLYQQFNPTNFNAGQWVKIAKAAGMKYIVLTSKHHDGFCLWDTKLTDYNIMNTPFHRDVTKELAEACREAGLVFCLYHSVCDWWHPDHPLGSPGGKSQKPAPNMERYNKYLKGQVAELLKNYGPLGVLWFDGEWESPWTVERGQDLYRHCRSLQDSLIINNRVGKGREGMAGTTAQTRENPGDYDTPEQTIGKFQDQRPWETCMTICNQWAWKPNDPMKSLPECLQALIRCAGGDGNLLFNVGPMPTGEIEPRQVERLQEMGAWLAKNGESIYGTRGGPWKSTKTLASTRKGSTIYLHVLNSAKSSLTLPPLSRKIKAAAALSGGKVVFNQTDLAVEITLPAQRLDPIDTIIKLDLDGSAMDIPAVSMTPDVKASASNVYQKQAAEYGPQVAFDGDSQTRWATDSGVKQAWIAADLGKPQTIQRVRIEESLGERVQKFELQYRDAQDWKTLFIGQRIGGDFQQKFEPVKAQEFRLNILDATEGPTIAEIELQ